MAYYGATNFNSRKKFSNLIKGNVSTVAVSSCTAAIHLSLLSLELKKK